MLGIGRAIFPWTTYEGYNLNFVGTNWKQYVISGTTPVDITAIRETTSAGDPRMSIVDESSIVTVVDASHGCMINDFVTFSGATGTEGGIAASVINAEHQVRSVIDSNNYTFDCGQEANATVGSNAWGTAIVAKYQTNVGLSSQVSGAGWGAGIWGGGTTVGWGNASAIAIDTGQLRNIPVDNYGEDLIYCNRGGPLYYWDFGESSSSGIPDERAKEMNIANYPEVDGGYDLPLAVLDFIVSERDGHVIAFGVNDIGATSTNALLVRWSDQNNPFDWEPKKSNTAGGQVLRGGSKIVGVLATQEEILIWTDSSLQSMRYVNPESIFGFNMISKNVRILSGNSAIDVANVVYFMGTDGFYAYRGAVSPLPSTVEKYVFDDINLGQSDKVFAGSNASFNEVYWFYPSSDSVEPNRWVAFNYVDNVWTIGKFDMLGLSQSSPSSVTYNRTAWVDAIHRNLPMSSYILDWDPTTSPPVEKTAIMLHEFGSNANGRAMDCYIQSGDVEISEGGSYSFFSRILPDVQFIDVPDASEPTITASVSSKDFPGSASSTISTTDIQFKSDGSGYTPLGNSTAIRGRGRALSVKFSSSNDSSRWRLGDTRIDLRPDGRR